MRTPPPIDVCFLKDRLPLRDQLKKLGSPFEFRTIVAARCLDGRAAASQGPSSSDEKSHRRRTLAHPSQECISDFTDRISFYGRL